jgi:putative hemolysin
MLALVDQIRSSAQLRWNGVHKFRVKVPMHLELGPYTIRTADTIVELMESFRLRHEVFNQEFRGLEGDGLDFDKFDTHFDHLIIVHRETRKIIGTYRLNCSSSLERSYTGLEFDLSGLQDLAGPYLELGRACIHKDYRKGSVISLLWRGIAEYMKLSDANILFGCSSLKVNTAREAALVQKHLVDLEAVMARPGFQPTRKFRMPDFQGWSDYFAKGLTDEQREEAEALIPSLLKSYLKIGAKVVGEPAFDEDFDCIDCLTIVEKDQLAQTVLSRFQR